MSDQASGQAQTPPPIPGTPGTGVGDAIGDLAMHMFGGPPPGGGKFTMDVDQINDTIKQWSQLRDKLRADAEDGKLMVGINAAGGPLDEAGKAFVDAANASGAAYLKANRAQQEFITGYIRKLTAVRDGHVQTDQASADQLNKKA